MELHLQSLWTSSLVWSQHLPGILQFVHVHRRMILYVALWVFPHVRSIPAYYDFTSIIQGLSEVGCNILSTSFASDTLRLIACLFSVGLILHVGVFSSKTGSFHCLFWVGLELHTGLYGI